MSAYTVYLLSETSLSPLDHISIFVETHEVGPDTGHRYHVIGNIQEGMAFNERPSPKPEDEPVFLKKERLGAVSVSDYQNGRFRAVCEEIPVPKKRFEGPRRLFPGERLRRCGEWAAEAVSLLVERGVLVRDPGS